MVAPLVLLLREKRLNQVMKATSGAALTMLERNVSLVLRSMVEGLRQRIAHRTVHKTMQPVGQENRDHENQPVLPLAAIDVRLLFKIKPVNKQEKSGSLTKGNKTLFSLSQSTTGLRLVTREQVRGYRYVQIEDKREAFTTTSGLNPPPAEAASSAVLVLSDEGRRSARENLTGRKSLSASPIEAMGKESVLPQPRIERTFDLTVARFGRHMAIPVVEEALRDESIQMVRIARPSDEQIKVGLTQGYFYKPDDVAYQMALPVPAPGETWPQVLKRYDQSFERSHDRGLLKSFEKITEQIAEGKLELVFDEFAHYPLEMQEFFTLYSANMAEKERGLNILRESIGERGMREYMKQGRFGLYLKKDGRLVGGVIGQKLPDQYSTSFSAFDRTESRAIKNPHFFLDQYLLRLSLKKGYRYLSAGRDINFYGHILAPGVALAKLRYGFKPVPAPQARPELMKITDYRLFQMPVMFYTFSPAGALESTLIVDDVSQGRIKEFIRPLTVLDVPLNIYRLVEEGPALVPMTIDDALRASSAVTGTQDGEARVVDHALEALARGLQSLVSERSGEFIRSSSSPVRRVLSAPDSTSVNFIRAQIKHYFAMQRRAGRMSQGDMFRALRRVHEYDFTPLLPFVRLWRLRLSKQQQTGKLVYALLGIMAAGRTPVMVSDFDDTMTPFTKDFAAQLRDLLARTHFVILTGNKKKNLDERALKTGVFRQVFSGKERRLARLSLFTKTGSEEWVFDLKSKDFAMAREMSLSQVIGADKVLRFKEVLEMAADVFDFNELAGKMGYQANGSFVEDRGSQLNLQTVSLSASEEIKDKYKAWEDKTAKETGMRFREMVAAYIRWMTGQLNRGDEEQERLVQKLSEYLSRKLSLTDIKLPAELVVPMSVRAGGRTNIDGTLLGMDKAWAAREIAARLKAPIWSVVFLGDSFSEGGNDLPALQATGLAVNVGVPVALPEQDMVLMWSRKRQSQGLIAYLQLLNGLLTKQSEAGSKVKRFISSSPVQARTETTAPLSAKIIFSPEVQGIVGQSYMISGAEDFVMKKFTAFMSRLLGEFVDQGWVKAGEAKALSWGLKRVLWLAPELGWQPEENGKRRQIFLEAKSYVPPGLSTAEAAELTSLLLAQAQTKPTGVKDWNHLITLFPGVYDPTVSELAVDRAEKTRMPRAILKGQAGQPLIQPGMKVLDIGAGAGITSILAAALGAEVLAIDIDTKAVLNTAYNVKQQGLSDKVTTKVHDGIEGLGTFDVIIFHSPEPTVDSFIRHQVHIDTRRMQEILRQLPQHLNPGGFGAWAIYPKERWTKMFNEAGLEASNVVMIPYQTSFIWKVTGVVKLVPSLVQSQEKKDSSVPAWVASASEPVSLKLREDSEEAEITAVSSAVTFNEPIDRYLEEQGLNKYPALKTLFQKSPAVTAALLEDSALRPVFMLALSEARAEVGPLVINHRTLTEIAGESLESILNKYTGFSVGKPEIANALFEAGADIFLGVTDRKSNETLLGHFSVANGRQVYFPLPDGTWLGVKGSGQFRQEDKPPFFGVGVVREIKEGPMVSVWNYEGLADEEEAQRAVQAVGILGEKGLGFTQLGGYRNLFHIPTGEVRGGQPVLTETKDFVNAKGQPKQPVLIFTRHLTPQRFAKLPQVVKRDGGFVALRMKLTPAMLAAGLIPKGPFALKTSVLSNEEYLRVIAQIMGKTEAAKSNSGLYKRTLHEQDINLAGQEADLEEFYRFDEDLPVKPAVYTNEKVDLLRIRLGYAVSGLHEKLKIFIVITEYFNKQAPGLLGQPLDYLKELFASYFAHLETPYLMPWTGREESIDYDSAEKLSHDVFYRTRLGEFENRYQEIVSWIPRLAEAERQRRQNSRVSSSAIQHTLTLAKVTKASSEHRWRNEDSSFVMTLAPDMYVLGVFDGAGSYFKAAQASRTAARVFQNGLKGLTAQTPESKVIERLRAVSFTAVKEIRQLFFLPKLLKKFGLTVPVKGKLFMTGTTAVVMVVKRLPDGSLRTVTLQGGDARAYAFLPDRSLNVLTVDNYNPDNQEKSVLENEDIQRLIIKNYQYILANLDSAEMYRRLPAAMQSAYKYRNRVRNGFHTHYDYYPVIGLATLPPGTTLLLSSDGVHDNLTDKEITEELTASARLENQAQNRADKLVSRAYARSQEKKHLRSKPDDITVLLAAAEGVHIRPASSPAHSLPPGLGRRPSASSPSISRVNIKEAGTSARSASSPIISWENIKEAGTSARSASSPIISWENIKEAGTSARSASSPIISWENIKEAGTSARSASSPIISWENIKEAGTSARSASSPIISRVNIKEAGTSARSASSPIISWENIKEAGTSARSASSPLSRPLARFRTSPVGEASHSSLRSSSPARTDSLRSSSPAHGLRPSLGRRPSASSPSISRVNIKEAGTSLANATSSPVRSAPVKGVYPLPVQSIHIQPDYEELSLHAAEEFIRTAQRTIAAHGVFRVGLGGGNTPKRLYERLVEQSDLVDWSRVEFYTTFTSLSAGATDTSVIAREYLWQPLLKAGLIEQRQIFKLNRRAKDLEAEAKRYNRLLPNKGLDLVILGINSEEQILGVTPHSRAGKVSAEKVTVNRTSGQGTWLTMTPAYIKKAGLMLVLLSGQEKRKALARLLLEKGREDKSPARFLGRVENAAERVRVVIDKKALTWPELIVMRPNGVKIRVEMRDQLEHLAPGTKVALLLHGFLGAGTWENILAGDVPEGYTFAAVQRGDVPEGLSEAELLDHYAQNIEAVVAYFAHKGHEVVLITHSIAHEHLMYIGQHLDDKIMVERSGKKVEEYKFIAIRKQVRAIIWSNPFLASHARHALTGFMRYLESNMPLMSWANSWVIPVLNFAPEKFTQSLWGTQTSLAQSHLSGFLGKNDYLGRFISEAMIAAVQDEEYVSPVFRHSMETAYRKIAPRIFLNELDAVLNFAEKDKGPALANFVNRKISLMVIKDDQDGIAEFNLQDVQLYKRYGVKITSVSFPGNAPVPAHLTHMHYPEVWLNKVQAFLGSSSPVQGSYRYYLFKGWNEGTGVLGLLQKEAVPSILKRFVQGELGTQIRVLSFGGVRKLHGKPTIAEAHRIAITFLEEAKKQGVVLTRENFRITVVDMDQEALEAAFAGYYDNRVFRSIEPYRPLTPEGRRLRAEYFIKHDRTTYQIERDINQLIDIKPIADLLQFKPGEGEKFDLVLYNFYEYIVEEKQEATQPIRTALIADKMRQWLNEKGLLLTTAGKWFRFLPEMKRWARGTTSFLEKGIPEVNVYLYQYSAVDYSLGGLAQSFAQLKQGLREAGFSINEQLLNAVYATAELIHFNTKRERGEPYLSHPLRIALTMAKNNRLINYFIEVLGVKPEIVLAAVLLHDVVEEYRDAGGNIYRLLVSVRDQLMTVADLKTARQIGRIVLILTQRLDEDNSRFLDRILSASDQEHRIAQIIKIFDRLDNLTPPRFSKSAQTIQSYVTETTAFVNRSQAPAFVKRHFNGIMRELFTPEVVLVEKKGTAPYFVQLNNGPSSPISRPSARIRASRGETSHSSLRSSSPSRTESLRSSSPSRTESLRSSSPSRTESLRSSSPSRTESLGSSSPSRTESLRSQSFQDGVAWLLQPFQDGVAWLLQPFQDGVAWLLQPFQDGVAWLLQPFQDGVAWLLQSFQDGVAALLQFAGQERQIAVAALFVRAGSRHRRPTRG